MEDTLITLLERLGFPVYRQGSLAGDAEYPDDFFTFWNTDSPDHAHYDNKDYGTGWAYQIAFYSNNPANTYSVLADAIASLKAAGWIVNGKGYDAGSDEISHTGRAVETYYLET